MINLTTKKDCVWNSLGNSATKILWNYVDHSVRYSMDYSAGYSMCYYVWESVRSHVWDFVWDCAEV